MTDQNLKEQGRSFSLAGFFLQGYDGRKEAAVMPLENKETPHGKLR